MNTSKKKQRVSSRQTPWWTSVMLAIASYCLLKYLLPALQPENPALLKFTETAPIFAPLAAILFLLLAAKKLYDKDPADTRCGAGQKDGKEDLEE